MNRSTTNHAHHDLISELFGVSLKTLKDCEDFTRNIELGNFEVWLKLSDEKRQEVTDTLCAMLEALKAKNLDDRIPSKVTPSDPIVQSVNINTKSTSYAGAAVVEKFSTHVEYTLYGYFIGKRIEFPVVEYYARNNWAKHGLKRIMMNTKGFFFFKFDTRAGLEAVLEGGPWMIRNSPIILKKWSMDTSLLKEKLISISIWIKLHDVPLCRNPESLSLHHYEQENKIREKEE
ncbi:zinc knuckle CX2CX4HX4C containing protein [Tanacetum coccineum]|uniref:Zinc knuckle CX2CX4HX4C containing protein n=1 Tax=Tanacetum coccineum TaxID=301880 RepID=A0ABQ5BRN2_9ASTR